MKLIILADASSGMGTGHIMRCMALAQAARSAGAAACMLSRSTVGWLRERLARESFPICVANQEPPAKDTEEACLHRLRECEPPGPGVWVILDGYHFTLECQEAIRTEGYKLAVVDDYAHLPAYSCDLLVNPSVCAENFSYHGDISRMLLGPRYALLREEFRAARKQALRTGCRNEARNALITLGGGDFSLTLKKLIGELNNLEALRGKRVRIIRGAMREEGIIAAFASTPIQPEILANVADMPQLLLDTDICVSAAGSTCFELCCLGVPFMALEIARNQREGLAFLTSQYGIPAASPEALEFLAHSKDARSALRLRELALVDGDGAQAVIKKMFQ